jgi:hypothetical protein
VAERAAVVRGVALNDAAPCEELRLLQVQFSTGVRISELRSIASILAFLAGIPPPTRAMNRQHAQLIQWYRAHWRKIAAFLPLVQLRDEQNVPIDGRRELVERKLIYLVSGE